MVLAIPPKEGYGKKGQPQAGIKGTDTLYFVVDIVGRRLSRMGGMSVPEARR